METAWEGQPVQLYALADLDASLQLSHSWIALGLEQVAVARDNGTGAIELVATIPCEEVTLSAQIIIAFSRTSTPSPRSRKRSRRCYWTQ